MVDAARDDAYSTFVDRPDPEEVEQHFRADKGYANDDVHQAVEQALYIPLTSDFVGVAMNP
jgi:hypothetical protein